MKNRFKDYWQDMDSLHYTQEQKSRIASVAIHAAEQSEQQHGRKRRPMRRIALVAAAAFAILIGTASATGTLKSLTEIFSPVLGSSEEQIELMGAMGQSIGVSDTNNGVTITADGIIGDKYNACIVYSISWDEENTIPLPDGWEENPDTYLMFDYMMCEPVSSKNGLFGKYWFTDFNPDDNAIQLCETISGDTELSLSEDHSIVQFENLQYMTGEEKEPVLTIEGKWELNFNVNYEDSSVSLDTEKSFSYDGLDGENVTVKNVTVSPIGLHITFELPSDIFEKTYQESYSVDQRMSEIPVTLTKTDGTVLDLTGECGYAVWTSDDLTERIMSMGGTFDEIIPLDDMATLTIGEVTYDIPHS